MAEVRVGEVRFHVYRFDHIPMHVHAKIGSGEVVIALLPGGNVALDERKDAIRSATASEVRKALRAADEAYPRLVTLWEKMH